MRIRYFLSLGVLLLTLLFPLSCVSADAPFRILVLPFYSEDGKSVIHGGNRYYHYQRVMRFMNNQFVRANFEVVNARAYEMILEEWAGTGEKTDGGTFSKNICAKYGVDGVYIIWLQIQTQKRGPFVRVKAILEGEGYDSAGRDLGAGLSKSLEHKGKDIDASYEYVEKEIGYLVGGVLTRGR